MKEAQVLMQDEKRGAVESGGDLWHVVEYCCEKDSLLSKWFSRHGHAATRMGLPEWDLATVRATEA
eukprot:15466327-Heterocapsa_arctica.AAC.1